ncbi:thiamine-phosphate kinase [Desulfococcaceae bacterium HSG8]|nr:thiamine-phosphate kinase [Desulfococcaceae bacterium HSG8]
MTLKAIGEFGFINTIRRGCLIRPGNVVKAIGDDAAVFATEKGEVTLLTTDMLVERIHFLRDATTGFNLGYKSLAVNLSDIAAMGGTAKEAFVSLAIPKECGTGYLEDLYRGMKTLAAAFDVNILGGDTTGSEADLVINISVVGSAPEEEILYRDTAQPGDIIFSTGFLGDSRAGLHMILNNISSDSEALKELFNAHILPRPYLREGRFLARQSGVHAAIDVSDGLSSDLRHIVRESKTGARLRTEKIPISKNLEQFCNQFDSDPVEYALAGGEDYTLLCTISSDHADHVAREYFEEFREPLYPIGEITDSENIELVNPGGEVRTVTPSGWDHFNK